MAAAICSKYYAVDLIKRVKKFYWQLKHLFFLLISCIEALLILFLRKIFFMKALFLVVCLFVTFPIYANEPVDKEKSLIAYDPEFWKEPLRLSNQQMIFIREINAEFYASVRDMASDSKFSADTTEKLNRLLNDRSNRIWNVLSKRQQAKWNRIIEDGYAYHGKLSKFQLN